MPIEIKVMPPGITISQGRTFMVTDQRGEISANTDEGVYAIDTRFISFYRLYIDHKPWLLLNSSPLSFYAARFHLTNPALSTVDGDFAPHTIGLTINRAVGMGIHEDFDIVNYTRRKVRFVFEVVLRADFADLFEVKEKHILLRGRMQTHWNEEKARLRTFYAHDDFQRALTYQFLNAGSPANYANGTMFFDIELEHGQKWHACGEIILEHGEHVGKPIYAPCGLVRAKSPARMATSPLGDEPLSNFDERQKLWQECCTHIRTPNNHVYRMYRQAIEDMGALRIYDLDVSDEAWVPAAGVPWFVTLFGRDSLIVSLQNMLISSGFALGALKRLAEFQASDRDDWRDAQPGKILHEARFGELAHFHTIPFTPYYGTADATTLYLLVLSEAYRWTGDIALLYTYREVADACLRWIDTEGDLDGDGFQEYKTFSSAGYENMGWKDSWDAVVYADGSQVRQPKALCELQGYVYDARVRMAEIFEALGEDARALALRHQAEWLKRKFNQAFWVEREGCFAFGLDADKRQITSVSSNAGHCLWSGIAEPEKARRTARRLLRDDMWSGWGVRT
ncbi:MAG: hypothetical protein J2P37_20200, partial [Ktedonobacteraceae bacterium]|nr:hypothetical protein [Ktedonobacteraceae bacterium]